METEYLAGGSELKAMEMVLQFLKENTLDVKWPRTDRLPEMKIRLKLMEANFPPRLIGRVLRQVSAGGCGVHKFRHPHGECDYWISPEKEFHEALERIRKLLGK